MKPNILFIMADQFRLDAIASLGGYGATPHLDALAQDGWLLTSVYANSAECIPARITLATGLYPHQTAVDRNLECTLNPAWPNWMQAVEAAGYRTSLFGKTHLHPHHGDLRDRVNLMHGYGLQMVNETTGPWASAVTTSHMTDLWDSRGYLDAFRQDMAERDAGKRFVVRPGPLPLDLYYDTYVGQSACAYLQTVERDRPWFCWVSFGGPHEPWDTPEPYASRHAPELAPKPSPRIENPQDVEGLLEQRYRAPNYSPPLTEDEVAAMRANYAGAVTLIDDQIGKILAQLKARDMLDNTLIAFTSDHGEMNGDHGLIYKANFLDPVINIPLIVRPPVSAKGQRGQISRALVEQMDIGATLVEFAGGISVGDSKACSFYPLLSGDVAGHREYAVCEFGGQTCVISPDLKIEFNGHGDVCVAFDRANDPAENRNIAKDAAYGPQIEAARQWLKEFLATTPDKRIAVLKPDAN